MYKYLIADYILAYSLSTGDYFSAEEPAQELMMIEKDVRLIFEEIFQRNPRWFTVINSDSVGRQYLRNKEYDAQIVAWLKEGRSNELFKEEKLTLQRPIDHASTKKKLSVAAKLSRLAVAIFKQIIRK